MLNGKFYTGLPPKMVERQGGVGRNRQESHFFWPDDSQKSSATETRVQRRNSLQLESKPAPIKSTMQLEPSSADVDTRQMFHKEFAKSSIQFYDNLQPNSNNNSRQRFLNRARREVTPKLTAVDSPRSPTPPKQAAPSLSRCKQAYSSTIQFYDYDNEADNRRATPKLDMNNKREMELNLKNSPKLQVKHNVRHLSVERELPIVTKKPLNDADQLRQVLPKRILKAQRAEPVLEDHFDDYMQKSMRQLQLRNAAPYKKHVTYNEQAAEYAYYDDELEPPPPPQHESNSQLRLPNMRTGSGQQQRQQPLPFMEVARSRSLNNIKSLNNYNKNSHNNYGNNNHYINDSNNNNSSSNTYLRKSLPKLPEPRTLRTQRYDIDDTPAIATATVGAATEATILEQQQPSDPRKHLRSSLCFNGDALVVNVGAAQSTSAAALARRSSAGQRINVGLPD
ncbi:CG15546 [Drosophila busckii]|uniref:CG15546 n=1 Tax=Drosophila busckii TaxID=30019 RepID=A0A0M4ELV8_DROBS|nr:nuclear transcription factor Y subunit gamma [Drosophila busckii]ALC46352.1 CG15546 [Drosophila busckii]